ncbi:putative transcription factor C16C4.22 [Mycena venus]|uniref:Putative transcription factor C16C4.22 n=1 Tax=Mycena venus TaxID=2733690 RepID=A0A8H6YQL2_9AGAR|nr:putative transcription factor C16C4.22 [Mycena venus]
MDVDPPQIEQNAEASSSQQVDPVVETTPVNVVEVTPADIEAPAPKKKREKREPPKVERPPGKTLLPISKVQHIIKADKDIAIVAKEATFLISCATEEFIKRFGEAAMALAEREKRTTVQYKDVATVVRKADEFLFLEEIIPWTLPDAPAKRKVKASNIPTGAPTLLDQFVGKPKDGAGEEPRIIINEDGTMHVEGDSEMADDFT